MSAEPSPDAAPAARRDRPLAGIGLILLFSALATGLDSIAKAFTQIYPPAELVAIRYAVQTAALLALMPWLGWRRVAATGAPALQLVRGVTLAGSAATFVVGLGLLPFATNVVLAFASPAIVAALSAWLLGERVGRVRWAAIAVGFAGVVIVVAPGAGAIALDWPVAFPLVCALLYSVYQLLTRRIAEVDRTLPNLFWPCVVGCALTALVVPFFWTPPSPLHAAILAVHALAVAACHVLLIRALALAPASLVAPFGYASLIWAILLGWLVFGERPTPATLGGGALIALSGIALARSARGR